ncbi:Gfo/Idh/MocA family oxidoreductase, partial [Streptomyces albogriseolus]|uniref:Gfo/Idh/MocA family protein n=1 Tax=Streptomyces albogriseolus TaxID=1887 RepID=UPI003460D79A
MPGLPAVSRRLLLGGALATGAAVTGVGAAYAAPAAGAAGAEAPLPVHTPPRRRGQRSMTDVPFDVHRTVRVGMIGLGNRGSGMAEGWAAVPGCRVTAVCDIRAGRAASVANRLVALGKPRPAEYGGSADAYAQMVKRDDIDLVYIATPWEFHHRQGKAALEAGDRRHDGAEGQDRDAELRRGAAGVPLEAGEEV